MRHGRGRRGEGSLEAQTRVEDLIVERLDDELLVYDIRTQRCRALNEVAAVVWEHADGSRTVEDLTALVGADDPSTGRRVVWLALQQLGEPRLLIETVDVPEGTPRRQLLRRLVIAGAVTLAIPLIRSINTPAAAQAATCLPKHAPCSFGFQCCSGRCLPSGQCQ